jgi:hypothetical protein
MAYEVRATSGKLIKPGNYGISYPVIKTNHLELVNIFTKDPRSGKKSVPLTPDRNPRGTRGGKESSHAGLRAAAKKRTIVA